MGICGSVVLEPGDWQQITWINLYPGIYTLAPILGLRSMVASVRALSTPPGGLAQG